VRVFARSCLWLLIVALAARASDAPRSKEIGCAVASAQQYLLARIGEDGLCADEYPPDDLRHGAKTALCLYALAISGVDESKTPALRRAVRRLMSQPRRGTYAVAMRALAFSAWNEKSFSEDVDWLLQAAQPDDFPNNAVGAWVILPVRWTSRNCTQRVGLWRS